MLRLTGRVNCRIFTLPVCASAAQEVAKLAAAHEAELELRVEILACLQAAIGVDLLSLVVMTVMSNAKAHVSNSMLYGSAAR